MDAIKSYLQESNPSFEEGLALFCRWEINQGLISYIARKRDINILRYHLEKKLRIPPKRESRYSQSMIDIYVNQPAINTPAPETTQKDEAPMKERERRIFKRSELPPHLVVLYDNIVDQVKVQRSLHEKMKLLAAAGLNDAAAKCRAEVIRIEEYIKKGWNDLSEKQKKVETTPFNIFSYRSYISKALKKKELSPEVKSGAIKRVMALLEHNVPIKPETIEQLKARGLYPHS